MTCCLLELDRSSLDTAPAATSALHDSMTLWYRLWKPAIRTIDGALGHFGARDDTRITDECIDDSVGKWSAQYRNTPMPAVQRPYAPENVVDYEKRLAQLANAAPVQPRDYPSDLRLTGVPHDRD